MGNVIFFFQAEDGIRDAQESRGLGDVYKRQALPSGVAAWHARRPAERLFEDLDQGMLDDQVGVFLSLIHI